MVVHAARSAAHLRSDLGLCAQAHPSSSADPNCLLVGLPPTEAAAFPGGAFSSIIGATAYCGLSPCTCTTSHAFLAKVLRPAPRPRRGASVNHEEVPGLGGGGGRCGGC